MSSGSAPAAPPRRPAKRDTAIDAGGSGSRNGNGIVSTRPKDPAIARALQLSTFEDNYSTEDFIGTLSEKLITESKADPGPFNPTPFLETFSPALDSLLALRQQVAERTKKMEGDVRNAEREYGRRLRELDGGFEAIGSSFANLEGQITDVGRTAARIGEQLESLHQTRSTAQATSLLLSYYLSLAHQTSITVPEDATATPDNSNPLEALFATRTSREGRARIAVILRRLMTVAKDVADNAASVLVDAEIAVKKDDTASVTTGGGGSEPVVTLKTVMKRRGEKEKADRVRDEVEKYCEKFEKEVLRLFDRSYRKGDPRMMAHCAKTLQDFNGGSSCVQIYVNQHDFFIGKERVLDEAEKQEAELEAKGKHVDLWKTIGDPDAPPPTSEPGLRALLKDIRVTVNQEAQIVKAVFPNPSAVMQVFLQRVFAQVIQQHLESLVSRASAISTLAVLRILHLAHASCAALIEDLKVYDATLGGGLAASTSHASAAGLSKHADAMVATGAGPLAVMLDHALEEIFVPWLEGSRYLDSESKNLVELYGGLLSRFTRYHETVLKAKPNSLLDRVVNQLSTNTTSSSTSSTAQTAAAAISKYANLFTTSASSAFNQNKSTAGHQHPAVARLNTQSGGSDPSRPGLSRSNSMKGDVSKAAGSTGDKTSEEKMYPVDGVLTVEMAERMLRWHAEAVGRIVELSAGDVGKNAFALSKVLAEAIGRSFVETALDSALVKLDQAESKSEPDLSCLTVLRTTDLVCHLWQRYTSTALLPLAGSAAASKREMTTFNQHNIVRMEDKINAVIQKSLDCVVNWLSFLLTKQKKNDYKPKDDDLSFARMNTEPCILCCDFLGTVKDVVNESLSGQNKDVMFTEIGVSFHSLLLDHYKKFPVNPTGGLMLTKDLASYQEAMAAYGLPAINDRFDMLRQLGNSFIVQPNVLRSYMTESHLGRIDSRLLRPYLQQRSDWSQFSRSLLLLDGLPADDGVGNGGSLGQSGTGTPNPSGLRKNNRLSAMSGVAGAGMAKLREALKEFESLTEHESGRKSTPRPGGVGAASGGGQGAGQKPRYQPSPMHVGFMVGMH